MCKDTYRDLNSTPQPQILVATFRESHIPSSQEHNETGRLVDLFPRKVDKLHVRCAILWWSASQWYDDMGRIRTQLADRGCILRSRFWSTLRVLKTDLVKFSLLMGIAVTAYSSFPQNEAVKKTPGKKFGRREPRSAQSIVYDRRQNGLL